MEAFEKKLPENLKSKLSFLFAKKIQEDDANFEIETTESLIKIRQL